MPGKQGRGLRAVWLFFGVVVVLTVVFPAAMAGVHAVAGLVKGPSGSRAEAASWGQIASGPIIASTLSWAMGIAAVATLLGMPAAWWVGRRGLRSWPWTIVPLAMPTYLAYGGYGLARAPGTALGDWLERAAHEGWPLAPVVAGKTLAFLGVCLWSWPIAALIVGWGAARLDSSVIESLRMEHATWFQRQKVVLRSLARPICTSLLVLTLLTLGSAVPLHLAQADTWSIKLWFALDNVPWDQRWRVWLLASPVMAVGSAAAWNAAGAALRGVASSDSQEAPRAPTWQSLSVAAVVWGLSTVVPLALFAGSIRQASSLREFWRVNDDAVAWSALIAVTVGAISLCICAATWILASGPRRGGSLLRIMLAPLGAAGLAPGVVVGAMVNEAWGSFEQTRAVGDSYWIVVLAHLARFAWIPALVGAVMASLEPRDRRAQRAIDGAVSVWGWWQASGRPAAGLLAAGGFFAALLSLHEIESSVMVQPPGVDGLARRLLQFLHFSKMEDLSAAGVWLIGGGLALAVVAAIISEVTTRVGR